MAQEKTNLAISQILGFSESTIRQESIRIYEKLRCDGRKEAAMLFNEIRKEAAVS
jgi:DNA-binding CsgD family transcriptional regulator